MRLAMTDHFTYDELTATSVAELQDENRKEGTTYLGNLLKVAGELEKVRRFFNRPVRVSSAFRCAALNAKLGGAPTSQHTKGEAADFTVDGYDDGNGIRFVFDWCKHHTSYSQLILERPEGKRPWIHLGLPHPDKVGEILEFDGKKYTHV